MKVMMVFGTRPEAIKMCPLVIELRNDPNMDVVVCLTGQHKEMLDQVMAKFKVEPDYNLKIMKANQTISQITSLIIEKMDDIFIREKPDIVLVHGDTTTSFAAALSAFYHRIPVGHVEAGLRTGDKYSPFPEEMNRCLTARIADFHFCPTENNVTNLKNEGVGKNVYVTGNTIIDSFKYTIEEDYLFENDILNNIVSDNRKIVLLTAHRRENLGEPLINIFTAVKMLAQKYQDEIRFVYPVHLNPVIKNQAEEFLGCIENITLTEPLNVFDMHNLISRCYMVMTDSGGLQEEAPSFGKPVLVMRKETERPEAVEAGTVLITGTDSNDVFEAADKLLSDPNAYDKMAHAVNPYGDGKACQRILSILKETNLK
ncbi:MAG: non-hydrolyzing UDP-N-acetylglucosamine 2-epimerase [Huintestinicola sp.]